jgi:hypothetical protein
MHSKFTLLSLLTLSTLFCAPSRAQEFMQDSIYYRIIGGNATVSYVNKYNTVIPATVTYGGKTYKVYGLSYIEGAWPQWRGVGDNVRSLTLPVTCDTIYAPKGINTSSFMFSGGKNLADITVVAPTSGKRHFLPCTAKQSWVQPYMLFGILAYQQHLYEGIRDTIYIFNVPPTNAYTKKCGTCYISTDVSSPTLLANGAIHHLKCNTLGLSNNILNMDGVELCEDYDWMNHHTNCYPDNYIPGQSSFKRFIFFKMLTPTNKELPYPVDTQNTHSTYLIIDDGKVLYSAGHVRLMCYAPGASGTSYTVNSNCKFIGTKSFQSNMNLISVTLPDGLECIEHSAFHTTPNLRHVNIPSTVKEIGFVAFAYSGISGTVDLSHCPSLSAMAFASCKNIKKVIFSPDTKDIDTNTDHAIPANIFTQVYNSPISTDSVDAQGVLEEVVIPEGIETIGAYAFEKNSIRKLSLPSTLRTIGNYAFWYNHIADTLSLQNVNSLGYACFMHNNIARLNYPKDPKITKIPDYCFAFNDIYASGENNIFTVPKGVVSVGKGAFLRNNIGMLLTMSQLINVGDYAFACQQSTRPMNVLLTLSSKLRNIGNSAFTNVLRFAVPFKGYLAIDSYGDLMTKDSTRLICLSHSSDDPTLIENDTTSPYYYTGASAKYHHGEDRILSSTIKTIDDLALCYNDLSRIVLPTGLENMPFINGRSLKEMTIHDKLMASIAEKSRGNNSSSVFIPGLSKQTYRMNLEVGSAEEAIVATNTNTQATLNVISEHKDDIEDWAKSITAKGYTGQILTNEHICNGWNAGTNAAQNHEIDFGTSSYKTFTADYPAVFDDPIVRIVTKVDMAKGIVYTKKVSASSDGKYHVPARTGENTDVYHGVILEKPADTTTCTYRIDDNNAIQPSFYEANILKAAPVCEWLDIPSDKYLLVLNDGVFKIVDNAGLIPADKAYLYVDKNTVTAAKPNRTLTIQEENEADEPSTGISDLHDFGIIPSQDAYYNVLGQRIVHPQKGQLYIHNNKKYIKR